MERFERRNDPVGFSRTRDEPPPADAARRRYRSRSAERDEDDRNLRRRDPPLPPRRSDFDGSGGGALGGAPRDRPPPPPQSRGPTARGAGAPAVDDRFVDEDEDSDDDPPPVPAVPAPPPPPLLPPELRKLELPPGEDDEEVMMRLLGFQGAFDPSVLGPPQIEGSLPVLTLTGFDSTKGTHVADNDTGAARGAVRKVLKREYRQYMHRKGGFNRPLSPSVRDSHTASSHGATCSAQQTCRPTSPPCRNPSETLRLRTSSSERTSLHRKAQWDMGHGRATLQLTPRWPQVAPGQCRRVGGRQRARGSAEGAPQSCRRH